MHAVCLCRVCTQVPQLAQRPCCCRAACSPCLPRCCPRCSVLRSGERAGVRARAVQCHCDRPDLENGRRTRRNMPLVPIALAFHASAMRSPSMQPCTLQRCTGTGSEIHGHNARVSQFVQPGRACRQVPLWTNQRCCVGNSRAQTARRESERGALAAAQCGRAPGRPPAGLRPFCLCVPVFSGAECPPFSWLPTTQVCGVAGHRAASVLPLSRSAISRRTTTSSRPSSRGALKTGPLATPWRALVRASLPPP